MLEDIAVMAFVVALLARQPVLLVQLVIQQYLSAVTAYARLHLAPALITHNALAPHLIAVMAYARLHLAHALIIINAQPE